MDISGSKYLELLPEEPTLEDAGNDEETLKFMKSNREKAVQYFEYVNGDDWTNYADKNGVKLDTRPFEGSDLCMIKLEMEVNTSAVNALKAFRDHNIWNRCDPSEPSCRELEKIDTANRYSYYFTKSGYIVSARDCIFFETELELEDDSHLLILNGVNSTKYKREEGAVEFVTNMHGIHFKEISDDKCKITRAVHGEFGGSIPSTLINWLVGLHAGFMENLKAELEK